MKNPFNFVDNYYSTYVIFVSRIMNSPQNRRPVSWILNGHETYFGLGGVVTKNQSKYFVSVKLFEVLSSHVCFMCGIIFTCFEREYIFNGPVFLKIFLW